ncbi:MAG: AraC family transcriptional regulator [Oceanospirillaceae bacterium]|jgi:AraC family transcriptional regulator
MSDQIRYKLEQALLYIDKNINKKITVQEIAKFSCLSSFHFHRVFALYLGETVNDYMLSRRLEYAAKLLINNPKKSIIDIALNSGFQTHSAFSRAFKARFDKTPSEHRKLAIQITNSRPYLKTQTSKQANIIVELKELPNLYFDYKIEKGTVNGTFSALYQQKICDDFALLNNQLTEELFGLVSAFPTIPQNLNDDHVSLLYGAMFTVNSQSSWTDKKLKIGAGLWAILRHEGDYDFLYQSWNQFLQGWLNNSQFQLRDTLPFELYLTSPMNTAKPNWLTDIYIPIEKQSSVE